MSITTSAHANRERIFPNADKRPGSFADHYGQVWQSFKIQTEIEYQHIVDTLVFELAKVESEATRHWMLSLALVHEH